MLISENYRLQNAQKHRESTAYGSHGDDVVAKVRELARNIGANTILDYGCGKRGLERALGYAICNYDPAIPGCEAPPEPADLVVCTDVLEHIEPECIDDVLDDLRRVTKNIVMFTVSMIEANKHMPDGRNAHLIVQPATWWLPKIMERFVLVNYIGHEKEFLCICKAKQTLQ